MRDKIDSQAKYSLYFLHIVFHHKNSRDFNEIHLLEDYYLFEIICFSLLQ